MRVHTVKLRELQRREVHPRPHGRYARTSDLAEGVRLRDLTISISAPSITGCGVFIACDAGEEDFGAGFRTDGGVCEAGGDTGVLAAGRVRGEVVVIAAGLLPTPPPGRHSAAKR